MSDPRAAKIIDNLLMLFVKREDWDQYSATQQALDYVADARNEHGIPLTVPLCDYLGKKGYLKDVARHGASEK